MYRGHTSAVHCLALAKNIGVFGSGGRVEQVHMNYDSYNDRHQVFTLTGLDTYTVWKGWLYQFATICGSTSQQIADQ